MRTGTSALIIGSLDRPLGEGTLMPMTRAASTIQHVPYHPQQVVLAVWLAQDA